MDSQEPRWDLIRHIREQIASGTYVTDKKLQIAVRKLVDEGGEKGVVSVSRSRA